jgi:hypothetical protein
MMSEENVRLVERAIAAINARDIEGYLACCTESIKLETPMAAALATGRRRLYRLRCPPPSVHADGPAA